jgi:hypothetical protein
VSVGGVIFSRNAACAKLFRERDKISKQPELNVAHLLDTIE